MSPTFLPATPSREACREGQSLRPLPAVPAVTLLSETPEKPARPRKGPAALRGIQGRASDRRTFLFTVPLPASSLLAPFTPTAPGTAGPGLPGAGGPRPALPAAGARSPVLPWARQRGGVLVRSRSPGPSLRFHGAGPLGASVSPLVRMAPHQTPADLLLGSNAGEGGTARSRLMNVLPLQSRKTNFTAGVHERGVHKGTSGPPWWHKGEQPAKCPAEARAAELPGVDRSSTERPPSPPHRQDDRGHATDRPGSPPRPPGASALTLGTLACRALAPISRAARVSQDPVRQACGPQLAARHPALGRHAHFYAPSVLPNPTTLASGGHGRRTRVCPAPPPDASISIPSAEAGL